MPLSAFIHVCECVITSLHLVNVMQHVTALDVIVTVLKNNQLFCFIPAVNNAFQFASIIHWISLAILSVFFTEVSLARHKNSLTYS